MKGLQETFQEAFALHFNFVSSKRIDNGRSPHLPEKR